MNNICLWPLVTFIWNIYKILVQFVYWASMQYYASWKVSSWISMIIIVHFSMVKNLITFCLYLHLQISSFCTLSRTWYHRHHEILWVWDCNTCCYLIVEGYMLCILLIGISNDASLFYYCKIEFLHVNHSSIWISNFMMLIAWLMQCYFLYLLSILFVMWF